MYAGTEQCLCVLRYLIPCSHLSRKQRCFLKQRDCYSSSAATFLLLLPSWCPGNLYNTNTHSHSEHIHWPKGADLSVSDSVGYCRGSDFLMDVNYLHYLWDACQAISTSHRSVSTLCSSMITSGDGLWINLVQEQTMFFYKLCLLPNVVQG